MASKYYSKEELSKSFELIEGRLWRKMWVGKNRNILHLKLVRNVANCKGYCQVRYKNRMIYYHTVVYTLINGGIPADKIIDHIDGNRINNNIDNLRLVGYRENAINTEYRRKGKLVGINYHRGIKKWVARGDTDDKGNRKALGCFDSKEEAVLARRLWENSQYEK